MFIFKTNTLLRREILSHEDKHHFSFYLTWAIAAINLFAFFWIRPILDQSDDFSSALTTDNFFTSQLSPSTIMMFVSITISMAMIAAASKYRQFTFNYKQVEYLSVSDEYIDSSYSPVWEKFIQFRQINRIKLSDITKLEWCEKHNCLKVYAPVTVTDCAGYYYKEQLLTEEDANKCPDLIRSRKTYTGRKGYRVFYAYYDDFDKFIDLVSSRSGVPVELKDFTQLREYK